MRKPPISNCRTGYLTHAINLTKGWIGLLFILTSNSAHAQLSQKNTLNHLFNNTSLTSGFAKQNEANSLDYQFLNFAQDSISNKISTSNEAESIEKNEIAFSCFVQLPPDFVECNNSATVVASDPYYKPTYSNNLPTDQYAWSILGGPFNYNGGTDSTDRYPKFKLQSGYTYTIILKYTTLGISCSDTMKVYRRPPITAIVAVGNTDTTICTNQDSIRLNASIDGPFTSVAWSTTGTGSFQPNNQTNTVYKFSNQDKLNGSVTLYFQANANKNGNCDADGKDTLTIQFIPPPSTANAGTDTIICNSNTFQLYADIPISGIGTWRLISGNPGLVFQNINHPKTIISGLNTGTYVLEWKVENSCGISRDTIAIQINSFPNTANAGSDLFICDADSIALNANAPINATGTWRMITGPSAVEFTNINAYNTQIKNFAIGVYTLEWSISNACGISRDTITINFSKTPLPAFAGNDTTLCYINSYQLNAIVPSYGFSYWKLLSGAAGTSFSNSNAANSWINGLTTGTYYLEWNVENNCGLKSDTLIIQVLPLISSPNAGRDSIICFNNSFQLYANQPAVGTGSWRLISGDNNLSFTNPNQHNTIIQNLTNGTYVLEWTIQDACNTLRDTISIQVLEQITNSIASDTTVCFASPIKIYSTQLNGGTGFYQYSWMQSLDNGSTWNTITSTNRDTLTLVATQNMLIKRIIQSGWCTLSSNEVKIQVQQSIQSNTIEKNQQICIDQLPQLLKGSTPTGGSGIYFYQWQKSTNSTNWVNISNATEKDFQPGTLVQSTWFRRLVISGACDIADTSNSILIEVFPLPNAKLNITNVQVCAPFELNSFQIYLTDTLSNQKYTWWVNDTLVSNSIVFPNYIIQSPSTYIKVEVKDVFGCGAKTFENTIHAKFAPTPNFSISDTVVCAPATIKLFNQTANKNNYEYHWDFGNGITSRLKDSIDVFYQGSNIASDTTFIITLTAWNECDTLSIQKSIQVKAKPKAYFAVTEKEGCAPLTTTFNNLSQGRVLNYRLFFGDGRDSTLNNFSQIQYTYRSHSTANYFPILIAQNECGADTAFLSTAIHLKPNPIKLQFVIQNKTICLGNVVEISNTSNGYDSLHVSFGDGSNPISYKHFSSLQYLYQKPGKYLLKIVAFGDCYTEWFEDSITVNSLPAINFSVTPNSCIGEKIQVQHQLPTTYQLNWMMGDGTIYTNQHKPQHSYTQAGQYTITLTAIQQYNNGYSCSDTLSKNIMIIGVKKGSLYTEDSVGVCLPFSFKAENRSVGQASTKWDFGDGRTTVGNQVTHQYQKDGTYKITMMAMNDEGCKYIDSTMVNITSPNATYQFSPLAACDINTQVSFNTQSLRADSVLWDFGDGNSKLSIDGNVLHTYGKGGLYYPKLTLFGAEGCVVKINQPDSILIDEAQADFNAVRQKDNCSFPTYQFFSRVNAVSGIDHVEWHIADTIIKTSNTTYTFSQSGNYKIKLIVFSKLGCIDSTVKTLPINIHLKPKVVIEGNTQGCVFNDIQLQSKITSTTDSILNYTWIVDGGKLLQGKQIQLKYNNAGKYPIKLIAQTIKQCTDTAEAELVIEAIPTILTANTITICKGESVQLKATGANSYTWTDYWGNVLCTNCDELNVSPLSNTQYHVKGYNQLGCENKSSTKINVVQPFKLQLSENDSICAGAKVNLLALGAQQYQWSNAASLNNASIANPIASPKETTKYTVIGKDNRNCFADTGHITIYVGNKTPFKINNDTIAIAGTKMILQPKYDTVNKLQWKWIGENLSCYTCEKPSITITKKQTITAIARNEFGCTSMDTMNIDVFCDNSKIFIPNAFSPDGDGVNDKLVVMAKDIPIIKSIRIFNRWGELVFEKINFAPNDSNAGWDGKIRGVPANPDVYVYICEAVCEKGASAIFKGNVAIIR